MVCGCVLVCLRLPRDVIMMQRGMLRVKWYVMRCLCVCMCVGHRYRAICPCSAHSHQGPPQRNASVLCVRVCVRVLYHWMLIKLVLVLCFCRVSLVHYYSSTVAGTCCCTPGPGWTVAVLASPVDCWPRSDSSARA